MKIVLFDLLSTGHHIKYASFLIRYLIDQGDEVKFITLCKNTYLEERLDDVSESNRFTIDFLHGNCDSSRFSSSKMNLYAYEKGVYQGLRYCYQIANEWKADIVHHLYLDRSEIPVYLSLLTSGRNCKWKFYATLFWPYFVHSKEEQIGLFKASYHRLNLLTLKTMLKKRQINGLFVHSENIKRAVLKCFKDLALENQILVIPDPAEQIPIVDQDIARGYLNLPQNKTMLLFFGGATWDKGIDILLESIPFIKHTDWFLVLAGEPQTFSKEQIENHANKIENPSFLINHLYFIPESKIKYYFSAADAVVLPYRKTYKGTSGILQLSASAGKPVIASNVGEIGQIVRENGLGILVEPESPISLAHGIQSFLDKKEEITKDVFNKAIHYAQNNDWRIMASKAREVYLTI